MKEFAGKTAVITGAASGMGFAMARRFAADGMQIVMADIEQTALKKAEKTLQDEGATTLAVVTDVSDGSSVEALKDAALDRFNAVHVLCNNAGVFANGPIWETPENAWQWVLGVNLWGVIHGIRTFVPLMVEQDEGHVVNTASLAGLIAVPSSGAYNASKHAVVGISETLWHDLAAANSKVKVSVLCPGLVSTNIFMADRNWPERLGERPAGKSALDPTTAGKLLAAQGMDPADVVELVYQAVVEEKFWILPHPELSPAIVPRFENAVKGVNPVSLGGGLGG